MNNGNIENLSTFSLSIFLLAQFAALQGTGAGKGIASCTLLYTDTIGRTEAKVQTLPG